MQLSRLYSDAGKFPIFTDNTQIAVLSLPMPVVALSIFHIDPFHGRAFFGKNSALAKNRRLTLVTHAAALVPAAATNSFAYYNSAMPTLSRGGWGMPLAPASRFKKSDMTVQVPTTPTAHKNNRLASMQVLSLVTMLSNRVCEYSVKIQVF